MKKNILLTIILLALPCMASAYDFSAVTPSGHTLYYSIVNGEAEVAKCNYNYPNYGSSLNGDLVIPDSVVYNGIVYPVTSIGHEAFEYATMRTVQIPNTVRTIVMRAFVACDSLTSLVIPNSVTSIGRGAFAGSFNIVSITLPDSLTIIEQGLFENDTSLVSVVIPDAVASVGYGAFSQCYSLRKVVFGQSVSSLGGLMFWNCRSLDTLVFKSDVAPSVGANLFYETNGNLLIDIPCGSFNSYFATFGTSHTYNVRSVNLSISVASDNQWWGEACIIKDELLQDVRCDSSAVIKANPNYGYHFAMWNDGDTNNPRTVAMTQDTSFVAFFAKNNYSITTSVSNESMGIVVADSIVEYLESASLTALPNYGFHFVQWNDGNTSNPRQFIVTKDTSYIAFFDYNQYSISLEVDSAIHGTTAGSGVYNYLSERIVSAIAHYGYHFIHWNDGNTTNPRTITLSQDTVLTAFFAKNSYHIIGQTTNTERGTVTGNDTVEYLDTLILTAQPNYGYHFLMWSDGNTENPRQFIATQNISLLAYFSYNQYTITLCADTTIHGSVSGGGSYNFYSERMISAIPNYGYHFVAWSDGNTSNPRTITLTQDTAFTAIFAKNTYTINAVSTDTIKGVVSGGATVVFLDNITLTASPNYGYHFSSWNDGITTNPRSVEVTRDSLFVASFDYNQYNITVAIDDTIHGTISGGGNYNYLSVQTINATANYGYHFVVWNDGDTNNPRSITLTQDTSFTAFYEKNKYTLTLLSNDVTHGAEIGGGIFDYLDTATIEATAVAHYHFVKWNDGNTDNPRQFIITKNDTLTALFAIDTHYVNVESNNIAFGSVEGGGNFVYGAPATVTAIAYSGYRFVRWNNGDTHNPYSFAVLQDTSLTAIFEEEGSTYVISAYSADETMGSVVGGGSFYSGGECTLTAIPSNGYRFDHWQDNNTDNPRTITVTGDATYTAYFASTEGIEDIDISGIRVYSIGGQIVVDTKLNDEISIYDMYGRKVDGGRKEHFDAPSSGVYLVKVGSLPSQKVVVIK